MYNNKSLTVLIFKKNIIKLLFFSYFFMVPFVLTAQKVAVGESSYTKELVNIPSLDVLDPILPNGNEDIADVSGVFVPSATSTLANRYNNIFQAPTPTQSAANVTSKHKLSLGKKLSLLKNARKFISKPNDNLSGRKEISAGAMGLGCALLGALFIFGPYLGIVFALSGIIGLILTVAGLIYSIMGLKKDTRKGAAILGLSISGTILLLLLIGVLLAAAMA